MANHITLPGILGAAAEKLGVAAVAKAAGTSPRTLYNWATNRSPTPAISALRIAEVCDALHLKPMLYLHNQNSIASTPQGWINYPLKEWGAVRYNTVVDDPTPAPKDVLDEAPEFGWPWMGSKRTRVIPVRVDLDVAYALHGLLAEAKAAGTMGEQAGVNDLMAYVAERLEEGMRRPGCWEAQVVSSLFGL